MDGTLDNGLLVDTFSDPSLIGYCRLGNRLLSVIIDTGGSVKQMTQTEIATEKDLLISLTLHNFSAEMIKKFAQKIAKPYFASNLNKAIRVLMENAINEEDLINKAVAKESKTLSSEFTSTF